jgi:hypothetical protein
MPQPDRSPTPQEQVGARVAIVEWVLPDGAEPDSGKWMDINMLCNVMGRKRA